jgi:hypothetical protein
LRFFGDRKDALVEETRRLKRNRCKAELILFNPNTDQAIGQIVDITIEGIQLVAEEPFETNTVCKFRMTLPVEAEGIGQISFSAQNRWCEADHNNPGFYNAGFRLRKISLRNIGILERLIEEFCCDN